MLHVKCVNYVNRLRNYVMLVSIIIFTFIQIIEI